MVETPYNGVTTMALATLLVQQAGSALSAVDGIFGAVCSRLHIVAGSANRIAGGDGNAAADYGHGHELTKHGHLLLSSD